MRRVFGAKKETAPPPSVGEATERINKRGDGVDEKIKKLDAELVKYREQISRTRGPAQQAVKARALRLLKQKKMYEGQRDMLYGQSFNLEQVSFATEGIKDAQQTMAAMKAANKELKGTMKTLKIDDIDKMQDDMFDLMDYSTEIQETLGRSYNVPDDLDEDELMDGRSFFFLCDVLNEHTVELSALEAEMGPETVSDGVPSYLQPDQEPDLSDLPAAPSGHAAQPEAVDEFGLPAVPRASMRN